MKKQINIKYPPTSTVPHMVVGLIKRGWSQHSLAKATGAAQSFISRVANGVYADSTYTLGKKIEHLYTQGIKP